MFVRKLASGLVIVTTVFFLGACTQNVDKSEEDTKVKEAVETVEQVEDNSEQKAYAERVEIVMNLSSEAMYRFSDLFKQLSNDSSVSKDGEWQMGLMGVYADMKIYQKNIQDLNVPSEFNNSHNELLQFYDIFLQSEEKILYGVDNLDIESLDEGIAIVEQSTEVLKGANKNLKSTVSEIF
jgi:hypothetical protein